METKMSLMHVYWNTASGAPEKTAKMEVNYNFTNISSGAHKKPSKIYLYITYE